MNSKRLYFIDIIRAFAILMMLQGHFIDTLLDSIYRNETYVIYKIWSYFRGITAPTFFTISGLIFTFLLLKAKDRGEEKLRIRKGTIRGLFLIFIGYLIRIPILQWFMGSFNTYFLVIDVLQCIGLSLILVIGLYLLSLKNLYYFSVLNLIAGILIFVTEPLYRELTFNTIPLVFSNYISKNNGSIFTLIPWFGYVAFGAFLATLFYLNLDKKQFKLKVIIGFLITGYLLIFYSSWILCEIAKLTNIKLFLDAASFNYLFTRLGNVFLYFAVFYGFENYLKIPLILKIGQKTLSIYVIHFIIIYGSFTGIGLKLIGKNLSPLQAIFGAILFMACVCFISFYYVRTNAFLYNHLRNFYFKLKTKYL
ncbi:heparan-alpha-glucosaminide N-acetyltransferase domain-containing protein [Polaribacter sp. R77954]|uniref:heparan-alpha-glucosaminide N-acetyltransferase domain-containing protein n=1 Tax=Polaribacter sp. R77954 TaxID=3093870 RepID=UPI0037CA1CF9